MTARMSRRAALGALGSAAAGAALPWVGPSPAAAQSGPSPFGLPPFGGAGGTTPDLRLSRISVDTGPLAASGSGSAAELVARDLHGSLSQVFADRMAGRAGATLLVRIQSIFLPPYTGGGSGSAKENGPDNMEGVGAVVSGGRVLSQTPLLATLDASYSGAWYQPGIDRLRVASISYQFAYWLRREMGV